MRASQLGETACYSSETKDCEDRYTEKSYPTPPYAKSNSGLNNIPDRVESIIDFTNEQFYSINSNYITDILYYIQEIKNNMAYFEIEKAETEKKDIDSSLPLENILKDNFRSLINDLYSIKTGIKDIYDKL